LRGCDHDLDQAHVHQIGPHAGTRRSSLAGLGQAERVEIDSLTAEKRLVEAGFGLALLPESSIHEELRAGTLGVIDAPAPETTVPIFVVHRKHAYLSGAAKALLAMMDGWRIDPKVS
jgi:DNA-binding transcriptional LysR family regulator